MVSTFRKSRNAGRILAAVALIAPAAVISMPISQASAAVAAPQTATVSTTVCDQKVCLTLNRSGNRVLSAILVCSYPDCVGGVRTTMEYHGQRTITGGESVPVGPQRSVTITCASYCRYEFTAINWTYYCGQWVYGRVSWAGGRTPVYRFPC